MLTKLLEKGMQRYSLQSVPDLKSFDILVLSAHHSVHHHEHSAH